MRASDSRTKGTSSTRRTGGFTGSEDAAASRSRSPHPPSPPREALLERVPFRKRRGRARPQSCVSILVALQRRGDPAAAPEEDARGERTRILHDRGAEEAA